MHLLPFFVTLFLLYAVHLQNSTITHIDQTVAEHYNHGVQKAQQLHPEKIHKNLFAVASSNELLHWRPSHSGDRVLTVTLTPYFSYYTPSTYSRLQRYIWVTAFPELHTFCSSYASQRENLDEIGLLTRLQQKLGLPVKPTEHRVVELWVRPENLFRPCADPEVTDNECQLEFPENASEAHRKWLAEKVSSSFHKIDSQNILYPFTQLGYTYDWYPESETSIGLSEYVIKPGSEVFVGNLYTPKEYCGKIPLESIFKNFPDQTCAPNLDSQGCPAR